MRKSKFTESQIAFVLRQADEGTPITEVCRKAGISEATFYIYGRLSRCKRFDRCSPATLGANIYPASPGMLARPNG
mgnify:CR=1 FL=1